VARPEGAAPGGAAPERAGGRSAGAARRRRARARAVQADWLREPEASGGSRTRGSSALARWVRPQLERVEAGGSSGWCGPWQTRKRSDVRVRAARSGGGARHGCWWLRVRIRGARCWSQAGAPRSGSGGERQAAPELALGGARPGRAQEGGRQEGSRRAQAVGPAAGGV
jgi:hypothetical protein